MNVENTLTRRFTNIDPNIVAIRMELIVQDLLNLIGQF